MSQQWPEQLTEQVSEQSPETLPEPVPESPEENGLAAEDMERLEELLDELYGLKARLQAVRDR